MEKFKLGYAMTGSFCTFDKSIREMSRLASQGCDILPIMSENAYTVSTRFGKAHEIVTRVEDIAQKSVIHTVIGAEPIGPRRMCDILLVAPCTGNTLSKIALGITDTPVTMAVKSQLRIGAPVVLFYAADLGERLVWQTEFEHRMVRDPWPPPPRRHFHRHEPPPFPHWHTEAVPVERLRVFHPFAQTAVYLSPPRP